MNLISFAAFSNELEKIASGSVASSALEVAGLGTLAAPHVYHALTGKRTGHTTERNAEMAGLGILAAPYVKHLAGAALKHASVQVKIAQRMDKDMKGQALNDAFKNAPSGAASPATAKLNPFDQMVRSHDLQSHLHGPTGPVHSGLELARAPGGARGMIARAARAVR